MPKTQTITQLKLNPTETFLKPNLKAQIPNPHQPKPNQLTITQTLSYPNSQTLSFATLTIINLETLAQTLKWNSKLIKP